MSEPIWPLGMDEAVFEGGPADGAVRLVALGPDGQPPGMVTWRSGTVFIGFRDGPAEATLAMYMLAPGVGYDPIRWVYVATSSRCLIGTTEMPSLSGRSS